MNIRPPALASTTAALLLLVAAAPAFPPDPATWAPADTAFYVGVQDYERVADAVRKHPGFALWSDPKFRDASPQFKLVFELYDGFRERVAQAVDTPVDKLRNPLGGSLCLFGKPPRERDGQGTLVFVSGIADRTLLEQYIAAARTRLREVAADYEKVDFGDAAIEWFEAPAATPAGSGDADALDPNAFANPDDDQIQAIVRQLLGDSFDPERLPSFAWTTSGDRLILASSVEAVKDALRVGRAGGTLADHDAYREFPRRFETPGDLRLFVNVPAILEAALRDMPEDGRKMTRALGFTTCGPVLGHWRYDPDSGLGASQLFVGFAGAPAGLVKLAAMDNARLDPPDAIPDSTVMYAALNLDAPTIVAEFERILRAEDPAAADAFAAQLGQVPLGDRTIDVRKDVINNLRAPLRFALNFASPASADNTRLTLSIGHRDADAWTAILRQLGQFLDDQDRAINGQPIFGFRFPPGLTLGVGGSALVVGDEPAVDAALRGPASEPLGRADSFRRLLARTGEEGSAIMFVNGPRLVDAAVQLAPQREQIIAGAMLQPSAAFAVSLVEAWGLHTMDNPESAGRRLREATTLSLVAMRTLADGILITAAEARP